MVRGNPFSRSHAGMGTNYVVRGVGNRRLTPSGSVATLLGGGTKGGALISLCGPRGGRH